MRVSGEALREDPWITTTIETLGNELRGMINNPKAQWRKYEIVYVRRGNTINIKYPGPDGQELYEKLIEIKED